MAVQAVFIVIFMFATSVKAEKGGATFWRKEVTLTCPGNKDVTWFKGNLDKPEESKQSPNNVSFTFTYERQVQYRCQYTNNTVEQVNYYFYVKGKACDNCFELDPMVFLMIIVVDVIGTVVVMMIIYKCYKKKSSDGQTPSIKPTPRAGHRAPHGPSAEYETLNPNTRSQDTYSTVVNSGMVHRTG